MIDKRLGITHLIDLTIIYPNPDNPLSILDIAKGIKKAQVYFIYKVYEIREDNDVKFENSGDSNKPFEKLLRKDINEQWLRELWLKKEDLMDSFYQNPSQFLEKIGSKQMIDLSLQKMYAIHLFYLTTFIGLVYSYKIFF